MSSHGLLAVHVWRKRDLCCLCLLLLPVCQFRALSLQPHSTLITFVKALSPNALTLGAPVFSMWIFGGAHNSVHDGNLWEKLEKGSLDEGIANFSSFRNGIVTL